MRNALRATLLSLGEALAPDSTLLRIRFRARIDLLLTLLFATMALVLSIGYQVLRHLPASWRESLLGDGPSKA
ncbi:MAG TPA: hypothetical protein VK987_02425 [Anaerolineae bacterium]|nr:hypothetical protein [Anaerolineae bacterium]